MEDSKTSLTQQGLKPVTDKAQSPLRWFVLFLGCIMMISNYYCYDNPAALKTQVRLRNSA